MIRFYFIFLSLLVTFSGTAQEVTENNFNVGFSFGAWKPFGDLADRYGTGVHGDISANYYIGKNHGQWTFRAGFMSSEQVGEDILAPFRTSYGAILNSVGQRASISARMAGTYLGAEYSRSLMRFGAAKDHGIYFGLGVGIVQHRIKFSDFSQSVSIVSDDYAAGIDRNTQGPYFKQNLFYGLRKKKLKVDLGLWMMQGFTSPKSSVNFDTGRAPIDLGTDLISGAYVTWYLTLSSRTKDGDIYY